MVPKIVIISLLSLYLTCFFFLFLYSNLYLDPSQLRVPIYSKVEQQTQSIEIDKWKDLDVIVSWGHFQNNTLQDALIIERGTGKVLILKNAGPQKKPQLSPLKVTPDSFDFKQTYGVTLFDYDSDGDDDFFLSTKESHYFFVNQRVEVNVEKTVRGLPFDFIEKGTELGIAREKSDPQQKWCFGVSSCHSIDEKGKGSIIIGCVKEGEVNASFCEENCGDFDEIEDYQEDHTPSLTIFQGTNKKSNSKFSLEQNFVRGDEILFAISSNIEESKETRILYVGTHLPFEGYSPQSSKSRFFPQFDNEVNFKLRNFFILDACIFDVDGDLYPDFVLAITNPQNPTLIIAGMIVYRPGLNNPKVLYLEDKLNDAVDLENIYSSSIVVGDFDNDMDPDIYIVRKWKKPHQSKNQIHNLLFIQQHNGGFTVENHTKIFQFPCTLYTSKENNENDVNSNNDNKNNKNNNNNNNSKYKSGDVTIVDFNEDGFLDISFGRKAPFGIEVCFNTLHTQNQDTTQTPTHFIEIEILTTHTQPPNLIGSQIYVTMPNGLKQMREVQGGNHFGGQNSRRVHFGLANFGAIKEIEIYWPVKDFNFQQIQRFTDIRSDQVLHVFASWNRPNLVTSNLILNHPITLSRCINWDQLRLKPTLFLLGVWKCGTTALYQTLLQHSLIATPGLKEPHFFTLWGSLGENWYNSQFPCGYPDQITIDASADYFSLVADISHFKESTPGAKLIVMVRDPVDRAFSHFKMMAHYGEYDQLIAETNATLPKIFDTLVKKEAQGLRSCMKKFTADEVRQNIFFRCSHTFFLKPGFYHYAFLRWLQHYSLSDFLVIDFSDWISAPRKVLEQVTQFAKIGDFHSPPKIVVENQSSKELVMLMETRQFLSDFFREENRKFYELLGKNYGWQ